MKLFVDLGSATLSNNGEGGNYLPYAYLIFRLLRRSQNKRILEIRSVIRESVCFSQKWWPLHKILFTTCAIIMTLTMVTMAARSTLPQSTSGRWVASWPSSTRSARSSPATQRSTRSSRSARFSAHLTRGTGLRVRLFLFAFCNYSSPKMES